MLRYVAEKFAALSANERQALLLLLFLPVVIWWMDYSNPTPTCEQDTARAARVHYQGLITSKKLWEPKRNHWFFTLHRPTGDTTIWDDSFWAKDGMNVRAWDYAAVGDSVWKAPGELKILFIRQHEKRLFFYACPWQ